MEHLTEMEKEKKEYMRSETIIRILNSTFWSRNMVNKKNYEKNG